MRSVAISEAGKVAVSITDKPILAAVRVKDVWSWGYASSDDLKDNFRPLKG
jgi:hypothetical protein